MNWFEIAGLSVAVAGLLWGVWWGFRTHRESNPPPLALFWCEHAVLSGDHRKLQFIPIGKSKPEKGPFRLEHFCVGVKIRNIGKVPFTAMTFSGRPQGVEAWTVISEGWHALPEEEAFPQVLAPGDEWVGLVDAFTVSRSLNLDPAAKTHALEFRIATLDNLAIYTQFALDFEVLEQMAAPSRAEYADALEHEARSRRKRGRLGFARAKEERPRPERETP
jgi:hypothetical protein